VGRWATTLLALALLALLGYFGWIGYTGSADLVNPPAATDCRTPESAFGWPYEAINYDQATDAELASFADRTACARQGAAAGSDLTSNDGVSLAGWYIAAAGDETGETLILVHDAGANKSRMLETAALFHGSFNLVLFDLRNHGQSEAGPTTQGAAEQRDVRAIVAWVEAEHAPDHIAVLGVGMGGVSALNMVAADLRVDAVIGESIPATMAGAIQARLERAGWPLSLPGAWATLLGGLLRTGQDMSAVDAVLAVDRLHVPLLLIEAGQDTTLPVGDAAQLLAAAQAAGVDASMERCDVAAHGQAASSCPGAYRDRVLAFLARAFSAAP